MNPNQNAGPSWWYIVLGVAVILGGTGLFVYTLLHGIFHIADGLTQIVVPGQRDLTLMPNLQYTIFLETESVVDGRISSTQENVSGLTCKVASQASGNSIPTHRPRMEMNYSIGGRSGKSVLDFVTQEAGVYRVACGYDEASQGPQTVVAVGSDFSQRLSSTVVKSLAAMFGGGILGTAIIVPVAILRSRAQSRIMAQASPSAL